jgi:hypothetical protein
MLLIRAHILSQEHLSVSVERGFKALKVAALDQCPVSKVLNANPVLAAERPNAYRYLEERNSFAPRSKIAPITPIHFDRLELSSSA